MIDFTNEKAIFLYQYAIQKSYCPTFFQNLYTRKKDSVEGFKILLDIDLKIIL